MAVDDSCRKPGAGPFKWEIRAGVPKLQHQQQKQRQPPPQLPPLTSAFINQRSSPSPPPGPPQQKLKPPPAGSYYNLSPDPRTHSFRSTPNARSEISRFNQPTRIKPECVSPGCFPAPLLRRTRSNKRTRKLKPESNYVSDLQSQSRWSLSSRRPLAPFYNSPASSFSSFRSSPRPVTDIAGLGFF
ncbi:ATPase family associated with various cellular activities (AAA) [Hibiscus syriacus]|uniref:ATPase family associated with various cellular activities (AAA) n=1 Tax=Hibiscus syriacus TaxID=106335 RepID=A0A6A3ABC0_HIBSY|nr:protein EARLY FLOWERING 5-like [Hibiscus syriacus]KAE8701784.1 ATPase family associated with various cellular activities (AAA) [Hibiscus syriacus]